ncbi:hypothetical protein GN244_ATG10708 [Phytophthora infestans]|uniref:Uncharacterized protein n=1 Tax=Phytophthora infestans TaxID=4787 RepID=A0A833S0L9_PHYIN|nr:hypothetical protein GN244_ATG10708 [Phytophthora infestans]
MESTIQRAINIFGATLLLDLDSKIQKERAATSRFISPTALYFCVDSPPALSAPKLFRTLCIDTCTGFFTTTQSRLACRLEYNSRRVHSIHKTRDTRSEASPVRWIVHRVVAQSLEERVVNSNIFLHGNKTSASCGIICSVMLS